MTTQKFNLDSITSLCLACSSSLPPKVKLDAVFITSCCRQPICSACISSNPRLSRYNPCLSCLGGVEVVNAQTTSTGKYAKISNKTSQLDSNIDGAVRDEDTYVIGDDEDDDDDGFNGKIDSNPPPSYSSSTGPSQTQPNESPMDGSEQTDSAPGVNSLNPYEYYIKKGDNLQGIAFKFGVDGRELCRLNKLPPSTLSTTPHILHTRTVLTLPPNARLFDNQGNKIPNNPQIIEEEKARSVRRARERAEKRLQFITKEVDWRVAKAYVALAEDPDELAIYDIKGKEGMGPDSSSGASSSGLEAVAVGKYLEDNEWEKTEGKNMQISSFPPVRVGNRK